MKNSLKVAKWEYKQNMNSKSFIISLFLTPLFFIAFSLFPAVFDALKSEPEPVKVYLHDEIGIRDQAETFLKSQGVKWEIENISTDEVALIKDKLIKEKNSAFVSFSEETLKNGEVKVYTSKKIDKDFNKQVQLLKSPIQRLQIERLNIPEEEMDVLTKGIEIEATPVTEKAEDKTKDPLKRIIPGVFAGVILFSIVITGMMIFQSASQEKKEKVAEIVLSSLTSSELMQGKIIGYFALGITQVFVWILLIIPFIAWKSDIPILEYLIVPETLLLLLIAIAGYLMFAAIFAGIGATIEDVNTAGNFQGFVLLLPWLPLILIKPVSANPEGIIAQIGSYFPLTSPGILIIRLSMMESWPWMEIVISLVILIATIWVLMKLAGKIFKTGMLMYGKNATPKEILKWLFHS
ncbi:ABC transporter permease [Bacillus sp. FJAT-49705]|uniref:ABC transporter permease n=1 Tax=Cytobacillus citreus TaxID=2833586 RepID=A0ABS5NXG4_9BACI|nr:ABC transporter permease [Cytobacillus citreus]MBS4192522.1 ABC transporter permease [Cytobacillus citreus]